MLDRRFLAPHALAEWARATPSAVALEHVNGAKLTYEALYTDSLRWAAALQRAGLSVSGVSYEPVTQGQAGMVVRTIPGAGTRVARGAQVHVIATALEASATPSPAPAESTNTGVTQPVRKHGKGRGGGGD